MENEIYDILQDLIFEQTLKKINEENIEEMEYPIKISKIPNDVLEVFISNYFDKYKDCLLRNAAIYAIKTNDTKYINIFDNDNIEEFIQYSDKFKKKITKIAFHNINLKIKYNKNYDEDIKQKNLELYKKLTRAFNIEVLTKKLRKIILGFIEKYEISNLEIILDEILNTNKFDDELIQYDNFLNYNNIKYYKGLIFRIVLSDNYLYLKSTEKDIENEEFNEVDKFQEKSDLECLDEEIIEMLEKYDLEELNDYNIRLIIYNNFIVYNVFLNEHKFDYENIKDDKTAVKTLKKINPYFFLDLFS